MHLLLVGLVGMKLTRSLATPYPEGSGWSRRRSATTLTPRSTASAPKGNRFVPNVKGKSLKASRKVLAAGAKVNVKLG